MLVWWLQDVLVSCKDCFRVMFSFNNSLPVITIAETGCVHSFHQRVTNLVACQNSRLLLRKRLFVSFEDLVFYTSRNRQKFPPHTHTHTHTRTNTHLPAQKTLLLPTRWHTHRQRCTCAHNHLQTHTSLHQHLHNGRLYKAEWEAGSYFRKRKDVCGYSVHMDLGAGCCVWVVWGVCGLWCGWVGVWRGGGGSDSVSFITR